MKKLFVLAAVIAMAPLAVSAADAPKAFNQCKACHKVDAGKNGVGPTLFGVFGAKAGHVEGYKYSQPHLDSGLVWDEVTLTEYLADPKKKVPGNKMAFAGLKNPQDVVEVIEYLKTLK